MKIPKGYSEEEVLALIEKISKRLAYKFIFPPYEYGDVVQEGIILGIEGLEKYSDTYPLENFLWVHIRRRLCTFKRNNYVRLNKPCLNCPFKAYIKQGDICTKFKEKEECELYVAWDAVIQRKKNINSPISMEYENYQESDCTSDLSNKEILELIDKNISLEMRPLWLKLKGSVKLTRTEMAQIRNDIEIILEKHDINMEDWF